MRRGRGFPFAAPCIIAGNRRKGQKMKHGISLLALTAAMAGPAFAQEETDTPLILLDSVTLSASSVPVGLSQTGATVDVVTAEDIEKSGDLSVAALLSRLPGVSLARNGGMGASTALRLRGLGGAYIGVRIDGIDVADPSGTQCTYDFGSTVSGGISRIEVLRGSQSALYGSEAIGGVVDITTYRAEEEGTHGQAALEAGSNGTLAGTIAVGTKTDRAELSFSATRTETDGISAYAYGTERDGFESTFLTFHGSYDLTETVTIGASAFWRDSLTAFDDQTADSAQTEEGELRGGRLYVKAQTGAVSHELSLAHTETSRFYPLGYVQTYEGERDQLTYAGRWTGTGKLSLTWGADRTTETFGSDFDGGEATTTSVYGEALFAPRDDLDLSLALRRDDHDVFGGKTTARGALAWRPTEDWVVRAVASTGFRAPSLYELYSAYGNTGLTPETSRTLELGVERKFGDAGSVQVTLFDTRIDDMIQFDGTSTACASGWGCYAQVPGLTRTRGVEVLGSYALSPDWTLFGNYTYTDAQTENGSGSTRLVRTPRHDLALGLEGQLTDKLKGLVQVQYVADFTDNGIYPAPASKMPDYTLVNLGLTYEISDTTSAYLRVENLFDEDYQTVRNYGQPGRQVFVGVRASF